MLAEQMHLQYYLQDKLIMLQEWKWVLQIFELGVEFEKIGDLQIQKVRLPANYDKKIKLDTKKFYVTIKLKVENEWRILFQNRLFCCDQDIVLYKRHVKEINDYRIE